jgi:hypothetical protein
MPSSKPPPLAGEVAAQALALLNAQGAELVVVGRAERCLAVSHKVEGSHHWNLSQIGP